MKLFLEFLHRKERESRKHLKIVSKALKEAKFKVHEHLKDDEDPYIFVYGEDPNLSFEGIRIYSIGDSLAYRAQKEKETEPFGKAYPLNLEDMFSDVMSQTAAEKKAGLKVIELLSKEIKKFFKNSVKAAAESEDVEKPKPVVVKTGGTDYSGMVVSKM